jgi:glycosyltransferase involved in cell wall biosynthesis
MSGGVSVVICCHNSAQRLPETLRYLAAQQVSGTIPWEVVVIDNASTDDTAETAVRCWSTASPTTLRVISEPQAGLSHARMRGIVESRYEIISFIDDDNWVTADWVEQVDAIFANHPEIGALGARIEAVCEIAPPDWFEFLQIHYAVGRQYEQSGDITDKPGTLLWGAGLSLRQVAAKKLLNDGFVFMMSDRKGKLVSSGGDTELCFALRALGWRFWYEDSLLLRHFIPKARLGWNYALRLMRGMGESTAIFTLYQFALNSPPFAVYPPWKRIWFFQLLKALRQFVAVILVHPIICLQQTEGSHAVVEFETKKSQLAAFWALRGQFETLQENIRQSAWARSSLNLKT